MKRFRGGLVLKAHRLFASLNSRLESNKEEGGRVAHHADVGIRQVGIWQVGGYMAGRYMAGRSIYGRSVGRVAHHDEARVGLHRARGLHLLQG